MLRSLVVLISLAFSTFAFGQGGGGSVLPQGAITPGNCTKFGTSKYFVADAGAPCGAGGGGVTSVGLALPVSVFTISGSPVTISGTLTGSFNNQSANTFFAGPSSGIAAVPTFRVISTNDISGSALTRINDTNVTLTLGGSPNTALLSPASLTLGWSGQLALSRGGTNANLSATGGTSQVLKQVSVGSAVTVARLACSDLSDSASGCSSSGTSFAIPTVAVGISPADAGVLTTALRSDAKLFLDQTAAYTFTKLGVTTINLNASASLPTAVTPYGLRIAGANLTQARLFIDSWNSPPTITMRRATGTAAGPTTIGSGINVAYFEGAGFGLTTYSTPQPFLNVPAGADWTDTSQPTTIQLSTTPVNAIVSTVGLLLDSTQTTTLTPAANASALLSTGYSLTGSNAQSMVSLTGTINTSGSPDVIKLAITDTARGGSTKFLNLYGGAAGASSRWSVDFGGNTSQNGGATINANRLDLGFNFNAVTQFSTGLIQWTNNSAASSGVDLILSRAAAATLQLGAANAASPVAQTLQAQGSRAGTDSNVGGANLTVTAGNGTGTGTLSSLVLQSPVAVASGTGAQTQTTGLRINNGTFVSTGYTVSTLPASPLTGARAHVTDAVACTFLGALTGGAATVCPVFYNGTAWIGG